MSGTALVVIGNGRGDYLEQAVVSASQYLPDLTTKIMVNDTGNGHYAKHLNRTYGDHFYLIHHAKNMGMAKAVQDGWRAAQLAGCSHVFHLEEDFVLTAPVPIVEMERMLRQRPTLASVTLKRPPWAGIELQLGDQLAAICSLSECQADGPLTLHRHLFSLNPSLIPRWVIDLGWPSGELGVGNESGMTKKLLDLGCYFSVWGTVEDPPLCEHIGVQRGTEWSL